MASPNFELITELQTLTRRDFPVADPGLLQPLNANPLVDGEWLELNGNYQLVRGADAGGSMLVFPLHTERGRYDTQAIGKANVLFLGMYEAESKVIGTDGFQVGDAVAVNTLAAGAFTGKRGLVKAAAGLVTVGYVSRLGTGKIRFVHFANVAG